MLDINFEYLKPFPVNEDVLLDWIQNCMSMYGKEVGELTFVFCSDDYLLEVNKEHLNHDYYTDIITFDYTIGDIVSGDLFISVDRVKENASLEEVDWKVELKRVVIHGCLHLAGFKDKTEEERKEMRSQEDNCLKLVNTECFT